MTIGQRIAELRKQHNLSQEALGEALGVSRQAISKWESDAALPEIDKLIALSKRFGVTVGYLLGVEEPQSAPEGDAAEAAPAQAGPTEAEVLERYLNSLPKPKPRSKWRWVLLVAGLLLILIPLIGTINRMNERISNLYGTVTNLTNQMASVQYSLSGITEDISNQVDEALKQEYGLLASWDMTLQSVDYEAGTAVVELRSVLKNRADDLDSLNFYARLDDGSYTSCDWEEWDGETCAYTARLTLPLTEGDLSYYLATMGGVVCLADDNHELCYLQEGTSLQVWCSNVIDYTTWSGDKWLINGWLDLQIDLPWLVLGQVQTDFGQPTAQAWLVYNGERLAELELRLDKDISCDDSWFYRCDEYRTDSDAIASAQPGDQIWVEYEVSFANGLRAGGTGDEMLILGADGTWESEFMAVEVG